MLQNVIGFDAALLSGKTCYGPFSNGQTCDKCKGALVLRFEVKGGLLVAHFWQRRGQADYDRGSRYDPAKTHWRPHLALYQMPESRPLSISGMIIGSSAEGHSMIGTYLGNGRGFRAPTRSAPIYCHLQLNADVSFLIGSAGCRASARCG